MTCPGPSGPAVSRPGLPIALAAAALSLTAVLPVRAAGGGVTISSYGHSALVIRGGGATVLVNPFQAVGCAAGLAEPRVAADVILKQEEDR